MIRSGFNVHPREVEEVPSRHPAMAQVAVLGVPHPVCGGEVCVRRGLTGDISPVDVVAWSRGRLGRHKHPRIMEFAERLPTDPTGKVLKRELRTRLVGQSSVTAKTGV